MFLAALRITYAYALAFFAVIFLSFLSARFGNVQKCAKYSPFLIQVQVFRIIRRTSTWRFDEGMSTKFRRADTWLVLQVQRKCIEARISKCVRQSDRLDSFVMFLIIYRKTYDDKCQSWNNFVTINELWNSPQEPKLPHQLWILSKTDEHFSEPIYKHFTSFAKLVATY